MYFNLLQHHLRDLVYNTDNVTMVGPKGYHFCTVT
jgi:hypothetical protein